MMGVSFSPRTQAAFNLIHEGSLALADVEENGIHVDVEYCVKKSMVGNSTWTPIPN